METAARIAALEGALANLRLRDIANGESDDEEPLPEYLPTWDLAQVEHRPQRNDPEELAVTLVRAGLAKKIGGGDNVASGAA